MQLGFIGLGRMGANMCRRLAMDGHDLVVHNRTVQVATDLAAELTGAGHAVVAAPSVAEVVSKLPGHSLLGGRDDLGEQGHRRPARLRKPRQGGATPRPPPTSVRRWPQLPRART